ncbi:hypothetical protein WN51_01854 [Melipona quadrifasciata]|uniref:Uncharacterized protein n=1 Tax=Melipona quadrifasciata TaxID=166423 RepID=A0A0N0BF66_9HYME|nr:hypothetical protein WN51_01854 [Melipona quadrifasciata]
MASPMSDQCTICSTAAYTLTTSIKMVVLNMLAIVRWQERIKGHNSKLGHSRLCICPDVRLNPPVESAPCAGNPSEAESQCQIWLVQRARDKVDNQAKRLGQKGRAVNVSFCGNMTKRTFQIDSLFVTHGHSRCKGSKSVGVCNVHANTCRNAEGIGELIFE